MPLFCSCIQVKTPRKAYSAIIIVSASAFNVKMKNLKFVALAIFQRKLISIILLPTEGLHIQKTVLVTKLTDTVYRLEFRLPLGSIEVDLNVNFS
jgi:hypothetical protein